MYGPLLDPDLKSVIVEVGDGLPTSLVCYLRRHGDEVVLRRDMDFVQNDDLPYFASAADAADAARHLLALDPYSLIMTTPLFSDQGGQLIADMYERKELDEHAIRQVIEKARASCGADTVDGVEAWIRSDLELPARRLEIVLVQEHAGKFLLSLCGGRQAASDLHVEDAYEGWDPHEIVSTAVVTRSTVDELDPFDTLEIGYRSSPATWTSAGPEIRVSGTTAEGMPFEQTFSFLP